MKNSINALDFPQVIDGREARPMNATEMTGFMMREAARLDARVRIFAVLHSTPSNKYKDKPFEALVHDAIDIARQLEADAAKERP